MPTPRPHIAGLKYPILFRFRLVNLQLHPFGKMSKAYIIAYRHIMAYHITWRIMTLRPEKSNIELIYVPDYVGQTAS